MIKFDLVTSTWMLQGPDGTADVYYPNVSFPPPRPGLFEKKKRHLPCVHFAGSLPRKKFYGSVTSWTFGSQFTMKLTGQDVLCLK